MKTVRLVSTGVLFLLFMIIAPSASAQKKAEATIKTTAECNMCKATLEKALGQVNGVKKVSVDITAKTVTVVYNPKKTDLDKIRTAITEAGYDADDKKANNRSYQKLPECCKSGQPHEHTDHK